MKIRKIAVTTDFSEHASAAFPSAAHWAKAFGAELHLVHAAETLPPFYYLHEDAAAELPQTKDLDDLRDDVARESRAHAEFEGLKVVPAVVIGTDSCRALVDYFTQNQIDLTFISTHGRSGIAHFLLGSVAEKLLRISPCPVFVVRQSSDADQPQAFDRVLVPFDFSESATAVFPVMRLLSEHFRTKFTVMHVLPPIPYALAKIPPAGQESPLREAAFHAADISQSRFDKLRQQELEGVDVDLVSVTGVPVHEIVRAAVDRRVPLVLMATHGWSGVQRLIMGSVAERIARQAPCSVLTVRPDPETIKEATPSTS